MSVWSIFRFFFFKQKTADEMRISDWSSDVCSSDLSAQPAASTRAARQDDARKVVGRPDTDASIPKAVCTRLPGKLPSRGSSGRSKRHDRTLRSEERRAGKACVS